MFGLTFEKLLLIAVLAVLIVGPDRLPQFAATLGRAVRWVKDFADGAKTRVREEMGPEFDEVDWKKLDPRQYDPRRIIREALADEPAVKPVSTSMRPVPKSSSAPKSPAAPSSGPVFDSEAT
ncbi:twin-arginine translocase TatA/TatE family subunit [Amnibacterium flavum]|uniref:Sec-independent protein translocase TatB n=1 Tax=Amnibacterium flavum TaxID=2173173 RepID=A0A2V1HUL3_9MICO|nr:twin-arginine translocase TatA/TatE family subunit [Amnibacterium flavum]PVZ93774.1 Sec-independent protein translocase TatB [Amnibacterium flavum]